jgi:cytochrome P450
MSVGPSLPPGALICVDAYKLTRDPERWGSDVDSFDPNRFLKLRAQPGQEGLHQFTSLGPDAPGWGDGLQACPGRTFAGNTIKIILAHLLTHYDIKLPPGAGKPQRRSMPNGSMSPDMKAKIMFRRRKH